MAAEAALRNNTWLRNRAITACGIPFTLAVTHTTHCQTLLMTGWAIRSCFYGATLTVLAGRAMRADSDGYACIGAGFIAIEFRAFNTPGITQPHVLRVARFDDVGGPRWAGEVGLEDFQTHTLACGARTIMIEGIGERGRGLVSYTIHVDSAGVPRVGTHDSDPQYVFRQLPPGPMNLGNWAQPAVIQLPSRGTYPRFQLRITRVTRRTSASALRHEMKTVLEEIDPSGAARATLLINEGSFIETGGETQALGVCAGEMGAVGRLIAKEENYYHIADAESLWFAKTRVGSSPRSLTIRRHSNPVVSSRVRHARGITSRISHTVTA
jgi:hypothetical protein